MIWIDQFERESETRQCPPQWPGETPTALGRRIPVVWQDSTRYAIAVWPGLPRRHFEGQARDPIFAD
jgi:hypothetical protein